MGSKLIAIKKEQGRAVHVKEDVKLGHVPTADDAEETGGVRLYPHFNQKFEGNNLQPYHQER